MAGALVSDGELKTPLVDQNRAGSLVGRGRP